MVNTRHDSSANSTLCFTSDIKDDVAKFSSYLTPPFIEPELCPAIEQLGAPFKRDYDEMEDQTRNN